MTVKEHYKQALLWDKMADDKVSCKLCNWRCKIANGNVGYCAVRKNVDGTLYSLNYHRVCSANPDPIEKKPLFHFQPGTESYSIATPGCNFRCEFCQNWQVSQMALEYGWVEGQDIPPKTIIKEAELTGCSSIAYTYTEPTIFFELCDDCGRLAKEHGMSNVFVSNGYMTTEAIDYAADWLDAINIDLKSFSEEYYKNLCKAKLAPVLDTIKYISQNTNIWMELTALIIPGENDSEDELKSIANFIAESAGVDTPWHISRFYPMYKMSDGKPTPAETLRKAYDIAKSAGLNYVYIGNLPSADAENTYCPDCGKAVIERSGYSIKANNLKNGKCPECEKEIAGRF